MHRFRHTSFAICEVPPKWTELRVALTELQRFFRHFPGARPSHPWQWARTLGTAQQISWGVAAVNLLKSSSGPLGV